MADEAEAGMAQMSQLYREGGNELYIGANGRGIEPLSGGDERAQRGQHD